MADSGTKTTSRLEIRLLNRQRKVHVDLQLLRANLRRLSSRLSQEIPSDSEVSLVLVADARIRQLNRDFADIDAATDVLSFPVYDGVPIPDEAAGELGDIIVSVETAQKQMGTKERSGHPTTTDLREEILLLFVHGFLHLIGYDHATPDEAQAMLAKEHEILSTLHTGSASI